MTALTLPVALARWMSNRLVDTLDRPLDRTRTYALTIVDQGDLDACTMQVRASFLVEDDRQIPTMDARPDALASVSRLWLVPDGGLGGPCERPSRPQEYARRRPALGVAVVADTGLGVVLRFEDDLDDVRVVEPRRAAGLLLPVVLHWQSYEDELPRFDQGVA